MTRNSKENRRAAALHRALALVTEAMDLLDGHGGPPDVAAHLELALQGLRNSVR